MGGRVDARAFLDTLEKKINAYRLPESNRD
jgi:hypothetical protein